ncbi:MAG: rhodanese-like domain-containing protein [Candidatus Heimdallarchaeota archaeon]|nr:rhodanese-like domain-containing protein [Candidatus Heimdallarchaeota archaeon]
MESIDRNELKAKLDRGDDFKLVMVLGDWHFMAKRIPGSINVTNPQDAIKILNPDDEIVVYCSSEYCVASQIAYRILVKNGYKNVRRYNGGIADWEESGFTLKGEMVDN